MSRFWKRRTSDPIETLLRANRPVPREEYVAAMLARVESSRSRHDLRGLGRRLALAGVVTALAVGAAVAAGGMRSASSGVTSLVQVAKRTVHSAHGVRSASRSRSGKQGKGERGGKGRSGEKGSRSGYGGGDHGRNPADHQYEVTICHYRGKRDHPYVEIIVSPQGAAEHARHHPRDIVPAPPGGCPTKLPPEKHHHQHGKRHAGNQKAGGGQKGGGNEKGGRHGKHRG